MLDVRRGAGHGSREDLQRSQSPHAEHDSAEQTLLGPGNVAITMQFWKPGTVGPGSLLDRASETEDVVLSSAPIPTALSLQAQRQQLPIFKHSKVKNYKYNARTDAGQ